MSLATITINSLEAYVNQYGASLFSGMVLPDGIDRQTVIDTILLKTSNFEALYTNPEYLRNVINVWSRKHERTFDKWIKALNIEYNPLDNYDRVEEWTDSETGNETRNNQINTSADGTVEDSTTASGTSNTMNKVSAYDSNTLENNNSSDVSQSNTNTGNTTTHNSGLSNSSDTGTHTTTQTHTGRIRGNIGVTSSDQLLSAHLELMYWSIYEHIADMFVEEMCILVY